MFTSGQYLTVTFRSNFKTAAARGTSINQSNPPTDAKELRCESDLSVYFSKSTWYSRGKTCLL